MNVLVACEESQAVCLAFREKGHNAFSCDIQKCSGGFPEYHIVGNVLPLLNGNCSFFTQNGDFYSLTSKWDLIIAHPPCTYLAVSGACNIPKDPTRIEKGFKAREFFMQIYNCDCDKIAIENPKPLARFCLPKYSDVIQPYYFGNEFSKRTYLWLKGLPPLFSTEIVNDFKSWCLCHSGSKLRSKTFNGIALAMANQWG